MLATERHNSPYPREHFLCDGTGFPIGRHLFISEAGLRLRHDGSRDSHERHHGEEDESEFPAVDEGVDHGEQEGSREEPKHAQFLPDPRLQLVQVPNIEKSSFINCFQTTFNFHPIYLLSHLAGEVICGGCIIPPHILPQHSFQELVPDLEDLSLRGVVETPHEEVAEDPYGTPQEGQLPPEGVGLPPQIVGGLELDPRVVGDGGGGVGGQGDVEVAGVVVAEGLEDVAEQDGEEGNAHAANSRGQHPQGDQKFVQTASEPELTNICF